MLFTPPTVLTVHLLTHTVLAAHRRHDDCDFAATGGGSLINLIDALQHRTQRSGSNEKQRSWSARASSVLAATVLVYSPTLA